MLLMRLADAVLIFPGIILALVLSAVLGPRQASSMVALGLVHSPCSLASCAAARSPSANATTSC